MVNRTALIYLVVLIIAAGSFLGMKRFSSETNVSTADSELSTGLVQDDDSGICSPRTVNLWKNSRGSASSEAKCPQTQSQKPDWACPGSAPRLEFFSDRYNLTFNASSFLFALRDRCSSLVLVGDSLSYSMFLSLECMVESQSPELMPLLHERVKFRRTDFLTKVDPHYYVHDEHFDASDIENEDWIDEINAIPTKHKFMVLNTGA